MKIKSKAYKKKNWNIDTPLHKGLNSLEVNIEEISKNTVADLEIVSQSLDYADTVNNEQNIRLDSLENSVSDLNPRVEYLETEVITLRDDMEGIVSGELNNVYTKLESDNKFVGKTDTTVDIGNKRLMFENDLVTSHGKINISEDGLDVKSNHSVSVVVNEDNLGDGYFRVYTGSGRRPLLEVGDRIFRYGENASKIYHEEFKPTPADLGTYNSATIDSMITDVSEMAGVRSVNGKAGDVTIVKADVGLSNVDDVSKDTIVSEARSGLSLNTHTHNDKINKTSIVNDLISGGTDKVLSAEMGKFLKTMMDNMEGGGSSKFTSSDKVRSLLPVDGVLSANSPTYLISRGYCYNPKVYIDGERVPQEFYSFEKNTGLITFNLTFPIDTNITIDDEIPSHISWVFDSEVQLVNDTKLNAELKDGDVIVCLGTTNPHDGGYCRRLISGTSGLDAVLVKTGLYANLLEERKLKVTTSKDGVMSKEDKSKLDGISINANNYSHPSTHPASIVVQDANNRLVTDAEKTTWNGKLDKSGGTLTGILTTSDAGIQMGRSDLNFTHSDPGDIVFSDSTGEIARIYSNRTTGLMLSGSSTPNGSVCVKDGVLKVDNNPVYHAGYKQPTRSMSLDNSEKLIEVSNVDLNNQVAGGYILARKDGCLNINDTSGSYSYIETKSIYNTRALLQTSWGYDGVGSFAFRNFSQNSNSWTSWKTVFDTSNSYIQKTENGYCKLPNGMLMQWGIFSMPQSSMYSSGANIAFPIAFSSNSSYTVIANSNGHMGNTGMPIVQAYAGTSTKFGIQCGGGMWNAVVTAIHYTYTAKWIAIGY